MIEIKSESEIDVIRQAGRIVSDTIKDIREYVKCGVKTSELDERARDTIIKKGGLPAFKGYRGYPSNICTSINEEVVHGIPSQRVLKEGDIISIDLGVRYEGYFADAAVTLACGKINKALLHLIDVTKIALYLGIQCATAGRRVSDISYAVQRYVESEGFSVVRSFVGHGIGSQLHEEPQVPNFGKPGLGARLKKGMVLAIEPMVNMGTYEVEILPNGWTAITKDRKPSAHFEHTVCVTDGEAEILTK